ncbi:MAG: sigma-70 family RNA polymerase sigma factor [Terrimicrobiaceae bacterium]
MNSQQQKLFDEHLARAEDRARNWSLNGPNRPQLEQEARFALLKAVGGFDPARGSSFPAFAGKVIDNAIKDWFRAQNRWNQRIISLDAEPSGEGSSFFDSPTDEVPDALPVPFHEAERNETRQALRESIGELSEEQRRILMEYQNGRSLAEIARQTGKSEQAVGQMFHRATDGLIPKLKSRGVIDTKFMPCGESPTRLPSGISFDVRQPPKDPENRVTLDMVALALLGLAMLLIFLLEIFF